MNKDIIKNISNLYVVEFLKIAGPLITLPILLSRLSISEYGLLSVYVAFTSICCILIDGNLNLGFINRCSSVPKTRSVFWVIFKRSVRIRLQIILFTFLIAYLIPKLGFNLSSNYLIYFIICHGIEYFIPVWFFQYIKKLEVISISSTISKIISIFLIVMLVDSTNFLLIYPLSFLVGYFVAFIFTMKMAFRMNVYGSALDGIILSSALKKPSAITDAWLIISSFCLGLFTNIPLFLLHYFGMSAQAGHLSVATRIVSPVKMIAKPVVQGIYPFLSNLNFSGKKDKSIASDTRIIQIVTCLIAAIFSVILYFLIEPILIFFRIGDLSQILPLAQIMCFIPLITVVGNIFGVQVVAAMGRTDIFAFSSFFALIVCIALAVYLPVSAASAVNILLITEISFSSIILLIVIYLTKRGRK